MRLHRPSPALIIAFVALIAALASPAGAAVKNLIRGKDIASNAITSSKVKDGSLLAKDFRKGQLPAGATGAAGAAGAKGATGATGATGAPGLQGIQGVRGDTGPAGPTVTGGAWDASGTVGPMGGLLTDLATGANTTGQVVLPWRGTIYVSGVADFSSTGSQNTRTRCTPEISDGTGPTNGLTGIGPFGFNDMLSNGGTQTHATIAVSGFVTKPAGTYNLGVNCINITNTTSAYSAGLTYYAVPATN